jgi:glucosamine--fructose-6-phosphate aminotransferase (isomerizing)
VGAGTLAVAISQSGETADTLAALREAKRQGALPIAICNVQGSMLTREAAGTLLTHAGPRDRRGLHEGVHPPSSWRSRCSRCTSARCAARWRDACRALLEGLARVPHLMEHALQAERDRGAGERYAGAATSSTWAAASTTRSRSRARSSSRRSPTARRGLPGGRDEARPIALIDERLPVVALLPRGRVYEKMLSNVQEVKARGGRVIAIASAGRRALPEISTPATACIECRPATSCVAAADGAAAQLLAYHVGRAGGRDVDQPATSPSR